jgi:hypothetical protein
MSYVFCDARGAGFHSNVRSCPDCGAPARRVTRGRIKSSDGRARSVREDVELEVRDAQYGRRSGTVERLAGV